MTLDDFSSSEPGQLGFERWLFRAAARASYSAVTVLAMPPWAPLVTGKVARLSRRRGIEKL